MMSSQRAGLPTPECPQRREKDQKVSNAKQDRDQDQSSAADEHPRFPKGSGALSVVYFLAYPVHFFFPR